MFRLRVGDLEQRTLLPAVLQMRTRRNSLGLLPEVHPVLKTQARSENSSLNEAVFPCRGSGRFPFYSFILRGPNPFNILKMSNSRQKKMICMYVNPTWPDPACWVNEFERGTF